MRRAPSTRRSEGGFTLLELMVVLFVITTLAALSVPVLQGFRVRAQNQDVQSELRNTIVLQRGHWLESGVYTVVEADLKSLDPSFESGTGFDATHPLLAVDPASSGQRVCLSMQSVGGDWFAIMEEAETGLTYYGEAQAVPCSDALADTFTTAGW